ncbi:helix-turn-helix domain-containing protein [Mucilaginibacter sp. cycad4]|uniref:winged helix-turn-helix transcriptional regulator n=1 Tax=Mucilaginibacter sp. cycad4 TaxID=3342096 RepID=UPI002AAAF8E0|nr:helix-turn-helix domain-containing protein [Mucilaginibacter gossypii]WPU99177.1 helix-turn-helix domain-containing protein [Mucilaginibacter gossypii]
MKKGTPRSDCPLSLSLDILGDKWTLIIIRDMVIYDKVSYNEFLQSEERIATNILADRLDALEHHGFITRKVFSGNKGKVICSMTEKSIDLIPIIMEYYLWGAKYNPESKKFLLDKLNSDKQGTIAAYQEKIRKRIMVD